MTGFGLNAIRIRMITPDRVTLSEATLPPTIAEHVAIVRAIAARDATEAAVRLRAHPASACRRALGMEPERDGPAN